MKNFYFLFFLSAALNLSAQQWVKIDSVFSPFGVTVQSFSSPEFCDIDRDGDFDLFVGSLNDDRVAFFCNQGTNTAPVFRRDTNLLRSIYEKGIQFTNSTYPSLVDLDGDNDYDLVIGGFNGLLFYRNIGDSVNALWEQDTAVFSPVNRLLGTDDRPAFADLDNDGDLDLIIGIGESFYGNVTAGTTLGFRNTGTKNSPLFTADNSLVAGIPDVGLNVYPALKDLDSDGDYDLVMGRDVQTMLYYKNTGTKESPVWSASSSLVSGIETTSYWKVPALCDLDGDGKIDLIYGTADGPLYFYKNIGTTTAPQFQRNTSYFQITRIDGGASTTSLADFDHDGDLDLLSGDYYGKLQYFRNDGDSIHPKFIKAATSFSSLDFGSYSSPRFVDIDNDGDYDIVSGELNGTLFCYLNTNGTFTSNTTIFSGIDVGWQSAPSFADINNDGNLDVLICGEKSELSAFYINTGNNVFVKDNSFIEDVEIPNYAYPCFVDLDNDGDMDLVFGKMGGTLVFYENIGSPTEPRWQEKSGMFNGIESRQSLTPVFADLDGDGKKDLIVGEYSGNFTFYKNNIVTSQNEKKHYLPEQFVLQQNYPNPVNPSTTIRYQLPRATNVHLALYDILGKEIAVLVNKVQSAGEYSLPVNAAQLSSGIYFYTLRAGNILQTKKMVVIK